MSIKEHAHGYNGQKKSFSSREGID
ncbi:hypothetical protein OOU_Y34scaffold01005g17 [Pyricularia oryzae Y34]|uniref:Uncharacterized protein n=1 Tax=Pyricularia oryzae (strain Y34) TaxID=1143189 RepID=A0AA97PFU7_PYRO3|nr:hypothetical protein OOU_Y34scaffold01005g17 [Pyricularia oryzae Y34]